MRPAAVNVATVVAVILMTAFGVFAAQMFGSELVSDYSVPCMEDQPCWDCSSMGNLMCEVSR